MEVPLFFLATLVVAALILAVGVWLFLTFNRLVQARNQQAEAWSGIEVQLKKRADLVPPLAACVSAYAKHERAAIETAAAARSQQAEAKALRQLIAIAEQYPELKADSNFRDLSAQLVAIEDDLQFARRYYNGSVRDFRNLAESFPGNLAAALFSFRPGEFFQLESALERTAPEAMP